MADRYWVGGTAAWDATAGTKWATTSGGAGGASVPTSADDVYFDGNSGPVSVSNGGTCNSLITTGFTGTVNFGATVYGSLTIGSSCSTGSGIAFVMSATSGTKTITTSGKTIYSIDINGSGGTFNLGDSLSVDVLKVINGTFNTQNFTVNVSQSFDLSGTGARTVNLGSSTVNLTITGSSGVTIFVASPSTNLVFNAGTSTIQTTNSWTSFKYIGFSGLTFYNFTHNGGSATAPLVASGSGTFNTFKLGGTRSVNIDIASNTTITANSFSLDGTATNSITITSAGSPNATFSKATAGYVQARYAIITNVTAQQTNIFYASNSSLTNATNWLVGTAPNLGNLFFGSNF